MLRNILFTAMLVLLAVGLKAQTAADSALAGEWVLEKMTVTVKQQQTGSPVSEDVLTDPAAMFRLSRYTINRIQFSDRKYVLEGGMGSIQGGYAESGTQEVTLLVRPEPGGAPVQPRESMVRYGWAREGSRLLLRLPGAIYREPSLGVLVEARYVCHFIKKN